jgi:hypothetical protein
MKRRELMVIVSIAAGITTNALVGNMSYAGNGPPDKALKTNSMGFERSGNPKASGGPDNPGKGNPHNAY